MDIETICQKCYAISTLRFERGQASLDPKRKKEIPRYDARIDYLANKLVEYVKNET